MKLSPDAMAAVISIVREALEGILLGDPKDVSQLVRDLDLEPENGLLTVVKNRSEG